MDRMLSDCKTCHGRGKVQAGYAGEELQNCPDCTPCGHCGGSGVVDSGGFTPWGAPIDLPCPQCAAKWDDLAIIGAAWKKDSSLEKWFPLTAEQITKLHDRVAFLRSKLDEALGEVASLVVGSEDRRPNLPPVLCVECGGNHEPSGARLDCLRHWKLRAIKAENELLVNKIYK